MLIKDATLKDLIIGRAVQFPNGIFAVIVGISMERPPEKELGQTGPRYTEVDLYFLASRRTVKGHYIPYCWDAKLLDEYYDEKGLYDLFS